MMLALLLLAQTTAGLSVLPSEGGGEVLRLPLAGPPWTEARLALVAPADPLGKAGVGAVAAEILQLHLQGTTGLGPSVNVRRTRRGLIVAFAGPEAQLQGLAHAALQHLAAVKASDADLTAAIRRAVRSRLALLRDPVGLARMEAQRALLRAAPTQGEVSEILSITAAEVQLFLAATLGRQRLNIVLAGSQDSLQPEAWPQLLPTGTATTSRAQLAPPPGRAGLQIIVIDRPDLTQAHLHYAWRPRAAPLEAVATVASALLGPSASWTAPTLQFTRSATVGQEAEGLAAMFRHVDAVAERSAESAWARGVATATRAVSLSLKDAPSAASALAEDLLEPTRTLRPVLRDRVAQLATEPQAMAALMRTQHAVVVIVTALGPQLVRQLADLRPGAAVHVYTWDQR